jgi:hypothetical protein
LSSSSALAGSTERLTRGVNKDTAKGWKRGVPAYVVVKLFLEDTRLRAMGPQPSDPPALLEVLERVRQYWSTKRWEKIELALKLVGEPYRSTDLQGVNLSG